MSDRGPGTWIRVAPDTMFHHSKRFTNCDSYRTKEVIDRRFSDAVVETSGRPHCTAGASLLWTSDTGW